MNQKGFTQILALLVIVAIISGVMGFSFGQKKIIKPVQNNQNEAKNIDQQKILDYEDKLSRLTKFEDLTDYSPKGTQVTFRCYGGYGTDKIPADPKIDKIKQELESEQRLVDSICSDTESISYVVNTYVLKNNRKVEQRIDFDTFTEEDFFTSDYIYQPEIKDSEIKYFKLNKWFSNNELIFSLIQWPTGGPIAGNANSGLVMTFARIQNEIGPKLMEFCNWGIAGGTSARYISSCTKFTQGKQSIYIQNQDLP